MAGGELTDENRAKYVHTIEALKQNVTETEHEIRFAKNKISDMDRSLESLNSKKEHYKSLFDTKSKDCLVLQDKIRVLEANVVEKALLSANVCHTCKIINL